MKCAQCRKRVSSIANICTTLKNAPTAILRHCRIIPTHDDDDDEDNSDESKKQILFTSQPLLFSTEDAYERSLFSFEISTDNVDECLYHDIVCTDEHRGEYRFYKAVKVDMNQVSESKIEKQAPSKNNINFCISC